jgi:hypothetical protein
VKRKPKTCVWERTIDCGFSFYGVKCLRKHTPWSPGYDPSRVRKFCCYCGLKIEVKERT